MIEHRLVRQYGWVNINWAVHLSLVNFWVDCFHSTFICLILCLYPTRSISNLFSRSFPYWIGLQLALLGIRQNVNRTFGVCQHWVSVKHLIRERMHGDSRIWLWIFQFSFFCSCLFWSSPRMNNLRVWRDQKNKQCTWSEFIGEMHVMLGHWVDTWKPGSVKTKVVFMTYQWVWVPPEICP